MRRSSRVPKGGRRRTIASSARGLRVCHRRRHYICRNRNRLDPVCRSHRSKGGQFVSCSASMAVRSFAQLHIVDVQVGNADFVEQE